MTEQNLAQNTSVREQGYKREALWLAPALLSAVVLLYAYLESHPYPAFGAGLYLMIAERISDVGYALPKTIPYYTKDGVPFAYPPLMFYVVAAIRDVTGLDPITITRYLPGLVTVAYLVPLYLLARDLLGSRPQAALASLIVAVSPSVLQWHISAGGIVRAPALLFALTGIYAGLRLYRGHDQRWVVPSLALFTLTILTHPVYTIFFGLSYFLLFLQFDRSLWGLTRGAVVALGGVALAAPWWLQVIAYHGVDVFAAAAGTHGGIGGDVPSLRVFTHLSLDAASLGLLWQVVPLVGIGYLLYNRRYFLPMWFAAVLLVIGKAQSRFLLVVGALIAAVFLMDGVAAWLRRESRVPMGRQGIVTFSLVLIAVVGLAGGSMYATSAMNAHAGSPSLPQFIDHDDAQAMDWVQRNTRPSADFVVQGDAAEWFPQQTHRTLLVGPWGVEWEDSEAYARHLNLFRDLSSCNSAHCMTTTLQQAGVHPDYVYLPKGEFTVRGMQHRRTSRLAMSMHLSPRYRTVFENDGVIIFEVMDGEPGEPANGENGKNGGGSESDGAGDSGGQSPSRSPSALPVR